EIVTAHLKHLHHGLRRAVTVYDGGVESVGLWIVALQKRVEFLHAGIIVPLRVGAVLGIGGGEDALRELQPRRLQYATDRSRDVGDNVHRTPVDLGGLLDRLGGEFRRGDADEDVGARGLQLRDMVF